MTKYDEHLIKVAIADLPWKQLNDLQLALRAHHLALTRGFEIDNGLQVYREQVGALFESVLGIDDRWVDGDQHYLIEFYNFRNWLMQGGRHYPTVYGIKIQESNLFMTKLIPA